MKKLFAILALSTCIVATAACTPSATIAPPPKEKATLNDYLRAAERSFQQIAQVAGRAGRGEKPGHVYVQTHEPSAPVIRALVSGDAESFYAAETESRREAGAPPFGRFAGIIVSSESMRMPRILPK